MTITVDHFEADYAVVRCSVHGQFTVAGPFPEGENITFACQRCVDDEVSSDLRHRHRNPSRRQFIALATVATSRITTERFTDGCEAVIGLQDVLYIQSYFSPNIWKYEVVFRTGESRERLEITQDSYQSLKAKLLL